MSLSPAPLFTPYKLKNLAPAEPHRHGALMTRSKSPEPNVPVTTSPRTTSAAQRRRRLSSSPKAVARRITRWRSTTTTSRTSTAHALDGWAKVLKAVRRSAVSPCVATLAHRLDARNSALGPNLHLDGAWASGLAKPGKKVTEPMTTAEIDEVIKALRHQRAPRRTTRLRRRRDPRRARLPDRPISSWEGTNERPDIYGGDMVKRTQFAVDIIKAIRAAVSKELPHPPALVAMEAAGLHGSNSATPRRKRWKNSSTRW